MKKKTIKENGKIMDISMQNSFMETNEINRNINKENIKLKQHNDKNKQYSNKNMQDSCKNLQEETTKSNEDLVNEILKDFKKRQQERKNYDLQWQLNINFVNGNQYCKIDRYNEVSGIDAQFDWQEKEVFNHLAPIYESRLAKLARVRPTLSVLPSTSEEKDISSAKVSKNILKALSYKLDMPNLIRRATEWSELCGTVFYKVIWDKQLGRILAKEQNENVIREGDVNILVIPPFEIYPDNQVCQSISDCQSIIHARPYHIDTIYNVWGVKLEGKDINIINLQDNNIDGISHISQMNKVENKQKKDQAIVLEYYEVASKDYPAGRFIIIAGDQLVYKGELPFVNDMDGKRSFPFIKQLANETQNCFWGNSVIDRLIPLQKSYNTVKNRKHEFLNRLSVGILNVEDGSCDTDGLEEEGLYPGKIILYRQGTNPPTLMNSGSIPTDFSKEESSLLDEMILLSGVSDLLNNLSNYSNMSGTAINLLVEQDDARLTTCAEEIRNAIKVMGQHILRLYKQFADLKRVGRIIGIGNDIETFYFNKSDITSEDIIFETQNEMTETISQKRSTLFELLNNGLLHDENGKLNNRMRAKIIEMLGFGIWEEGQDILALQRKKAKSENLICEQKGECPEVTEIDDHDIHINEHISYLLSMQIDNTNEKKNKIIKALTEHIKMHKVVKSMQDNMSNQQDNSKNQQDTSVITK